MGVDRRLFTAVATRIATRGVIAISVIGSDTQKRPLEKGALQVLLESPERDSNS